MASRRKECRCETTEDGYVMFDTIFSKRGFCKSKGAKWDPAQRAWRFPLSAASSAEELVAAYYKADYDADSKAGRHQKKRRDDEARKQHKEEHAAELERMLAKWSAELTATDTIERGRWPDFACSEHDDRLEFVTGPDDNHPALADSYGAHHRPRPGVLIRVVNWG